jgi:integrase
MPTGLRRAEVLALRWSDVDLDAGKLYVRRNLIVVRGQRIEKDTKTHRMRRISLDPATVDVLGAHRERYESQINQLGLQPTSQPDDPANVKMAALSPTARVGAGQRGAGQTSRY